MKHVDIDDDGELNNKYRHKQGNAKRHGLKCLLTFDQYAGLVREAGIKSSDIGPGGYHLSRYKDRGDYEVGNCRFVPYQVNMDERGPVDPAKLSVALRQYYQNHPGSFTGKAHSKKTKQRIGLANHVSQAGVRNSQHGTCWITNGKISKKIKRTATLPIGWRYGRAGNHINQFAAIV